MNKPTYPTSSSASTAPVYDDDAYGWAMAQAAFLRERRFDTIDWDNVAEEIESMGKKELRSAESALRIVLMHHLKWQHQPLFRSRSWAGSIREHLRRFDRIISENPSLAPKLEQILHAAYEDAKFEAAQETGFMPADFPTTPPKWDEIRQERSVDG